MSVLDKDTDLFFPHVLIIDASAGSGKTETLAKRFAQFLLSSHIQHNDLTNILAITFTNNAAREMKERIMKWLKLCALGINTREHKELGVLVSLTPDILAQHANRVVDTIIDRYSDFHIRTIDSFMTRILHASAIELGLPLHCEITESYMNLIDLALSVMLRDLHTSITEQDIERFLDLLEYEAGSSFIWDPSWRLEQRFGEFLKAEGKELLDISFLEDSDAYEEILKTIRTYYDKVKEKGYEANMRAPAKDALNSHVFSIARFITGFSPETLWFKKRGIDEEARILCEGLYEAVQNFVELYARSHYRHYAPFYQRFKKSMQQVKQQCETLHFDDINKKLARYIRTENIPEIYYRLGDVLHHFLLDEFQDTDIVQWKNMHLLLEEAFAKGGSLFAVGDLKQAIYMFRKADYHIMHRIVEGIRTQREYEDYYLPLSVIPHARVERLKENYRSAPVILEYVDMIFKHKLKTLTGTTLLKEDVTGLTSYEQRVVQVRDPGNAKDRTAQGYVRTIVLTRDKNDPEKSILHEIMRDITARFQYRDIAILARRNTEVERIVEWLTDERIPAASFSSLDIRKRKVIMEIIALVRFLDTPVDSLAFLTFLLGDIFRRNIETSGMLVSMNDVQQDLFCQCQSSSKNLYVWFREQPQFKNLWNIYFDDVFNKVGYMPLYDLISQVYRTFKVFDCFPEETGFLVKFLEAVSSLESRGLNNVKDFLEMATGENSESVFEIVLPDYIDAVKVMTFHKAKGLGFPVVINMLYEGSRRADPLYIHEEEGQLVPYYITKDFAKISSKLGHIYNTAHQENNIQDLNMLYVANTRAKQEMYNIVVRKPRASNISSHDNSYMDLFDTYEKGEKERTEKETIELHPLVIDIPETVHMPLPRDEGGTWSSERLADMRKGDIYHEILASIRTLEDLGLLGACVQRVLTSARSTYDKGEILHTIESFILHPNIVPWFEKQPDRQILREANLVAPDGSLYRPDRIVVDIDQVAVIDFKTGAPLAHYEIQVKRYMAIAREVYHGRKIRGFLAFIDSQSIQEIA